MSRRSERDALLNNDFIDFDAFFGDRRKRAPHPKPSPRRKAATQAPPSESGVLARPTRRGRGRGPCS